MISTPYAPANAAKKSLYFGSTAQKKLTAPALLPVPAASADSATLTPKAESPVAKLSWGIVSPAEAQAVFLQLDKLLNVKTSSRLRDLGHFFHAFTRINFLSQTDEEFLQAARFKAINEAFGLPGKENTLSRDKFKTKGGEFNREEYARVRGIYYQDGLGRRQLKNYSLSKQLTNALKVDKKDEATSQIPEGLRNKTVETFDLPKLLGAYLGYPADWGWKAVVASAIDCGQPLTPYIPGQVDQPAKDAKDPLEGIDSVSAAFIMNPLQLLM